VAKIALGDGVESGGVVEDMVIKGEVTTVTYYQIDALGFEMTAERI
jgi:hypothetical protein